MRYEVVSQQRVGRALEAETLWILTDAEASQYGRVLERPASDLNLLASVHHVLSPSRSAAFGQRIITNAGGAFLHADGDFITPEEIKAGDPRLWEYTVAGSQTRRWRRTTNQQVQAYEFAPTSGEFATEFLDPQWQREQIARDVDAELARIAAWKGGLIDGQLTRGDPIERIQRTTLNLQVGASGDDGWRNGTSFASGDTQHYVGVFSNTEEAYARFTSVSGLSGATVNSADYQLYGAFGGGSPLTKVYADEAAAPAAPTSSADMTGRTRTTAGVDWDGTLTVSTFNTKSITSVIQELADTYDPSTIVTLHDDDGSGSFDEQAHSTYDAASAQAPKLDIDYTAGGGGGVALHERKYPHGTLRGVVRGSV